MSLRSLGYSRERKQTDGKCDEQRHNCVPTALELLLLRLLGQVIYLELPWFCSTHSRSGWGIRVSMHRVVALRKV
jgi:hypothetical protein